MTAHFADAGPLSITLEREGRTASIIVGGEVDVTAVGAMIEAATRIHPAHDRVVIDLSGVTFIDVRGYGGVLAARDALAATGCSVEVVTTGMTELMLDVAQSASDQPDLPRRFTS